MIENLQLQETKIFSLLSLSLKEFTNLKPICEYNPILLSSGVTRFDNTKVYLDTSSVEGINRISEGEQITFSKRPSRANMQPVSNSIWFAKMKSSYKSLILTKKDIDIIDNNILSTGFLGILATDNFPLSLVSAIVISDSFQAQRDVNSVGTTMAGINNDTFMKIMVPSLNEKEINCFDTKFNPLIERLSDIRIKLRSLKKIKVNLLSKYFGI